jgi:predicted acylesterase/phospholipase RssA
LGCAEFLAAPSGYALPAAPQARPGEARDLHVLVLSGGGKYGAYGAGFLKGWVEAEAKGQLGDGNPPLSAFTIVTGISTGAMLQTFASVGTLGGSRGAEAIDDAYGIYTNVSDVDLVQTRGLVASLRSNGLADPARGSDGGLQALLADRLARYWPDLQAMDPSHASLTGIVNLDNGSFYAADLLAIARAGQPQGPQCARELVLASSAVPVGFPPRFIDGSPYADGGVRFGAFMAGPLLDNLAASGPVRVHLRVIVNGNLSPNDPQDDAGRALACDQSTPLSAASQCKPVKNELLPIAFRAASDILVAQVYRDSVYRLQRELEARGMLESSGFAFVPNARIAEAGCRRATKDNFDKAYMRCLAGIGYRDGLAQAWRSFSETPSEITPGELAPGHIAPGESAPSGR